MKKIFRGSTEKKKEDKKADIAIHDSKIEDSLQLKKDGAHLALGGQSVGVHVEVPKAEIPRAGFGLAFGSSGHSPKAEVHGGNISANIEAPKVEAPHLGLGLGLGNTHGGNISANIEAPKLEAPHLGLGLGLGNTHGGNISTNIEAPKVELPSLEAPHLGFGIGLHSSGSHPGGGSPKSEAKHSEVTDSQEHNASSGNATSTSSSATTASSEMTTKAKPSNKFPSIDAQWSSSSGGGGRTGSSSFSSSSHSSSMSSSQQGGGSHGQQGGGSHGQQGGGSYGQQGGGSYGQQGGGSYGQQGGGDSQSHQMSGNHNPSMEGSFKMSSSSGYNTMPASISVSSGGSGGNSAQYSSSYSSSNQPVQYSSSSSTTTGTAPQAAQRTSAQSMNDVSGLRNDGQLAEWLENDARATGVGSGSMHISGGANVGGRFIERPIALRGDGKHGISNGDSSIITSKFSISSPQLMDDKDRPMSPTTRLISLSRIDEKNQLVSLNDRLASILSRNRQLENENSLLHSQLRDANMKLTLITNELTRTFEEETNGLRIQLQDTQKDKIRLEMQLKKLQHDYNGLIDKLRGHEDEITTLNRTIKTLQARIASLTMDLKGRDDDRGKLSREKQELSERVLKITKELEDVQTQYEAEAMTKVELEHQLRNKEDEVQMKMQIHQQQFSELMLTRTDESSQVGGQLKMEYDARLADAIRQLRIDCELQLAGHREEQEALYYKKEQALHGEMSRLRLSLEGQGGEMGNLTLKLTALERRLALISAEKSNLEDQLRDMEGGWATDKTAFSAERARLEALIAEMQQERFQLLTDYQQLMEIKVGLDNEIATYRSLLESEEDRLARLLAQEEERMKMLMEAQITPTFEIKRTVRTVTETTPENFTTSGGGGGGGGGMSYSSNISGGGGGGGGGSTGYSVSGGGGSIGHSVSGGGGGGGSIGYSSSSGGGGGGSIGYSATSGGGGGGSIGYSATSGGGGGGSISYSSQSGGGSTVHRTESPSGGSFRTSSPAGSFRTASPAQGSYSYSSSTTDPAHGGTQSYKYETRF